METGLQPTDPNRSPTIVMHPPPDIHLHQLSEETIETITSSLDSVSFGFFTLLGGLTVTFWTVYKTVELTADDKNLFIMLTYSSAVLTVGAFVGFIVTFGRKRRKIGEVLGKEGWKRYF